MDQSVTESRLQRGVCIGEYRSSTSPFASTKDCEIYSGTDRRERRVVIKKLKAPANAERAKAFRAEADALRAASEVPVAAVPSFVALVDEDGDLALVQEFVEGQGLRTPRRRENFNRWRPYEVRRFLEHMLSTLGAVHGQGYVHNDIRPANILHRPSDTLQPFVLIDFGDADRRGPAGRYRANAGTGTIPTPKPGYVAPERLEGGPGYFCSDLYSLGVIAIQLLTGAEAGDLTWGAQGHVIMPLYSSAKDAALERVLISMTCRFPWQRYQDAGEALAALSKLDTGEILDKPVEKPRTGRTVVAVVALILLLLVGTFAWKAAVREYCRQSIDCAADASPR